MLDRHPFAVRALVLLLLLFAPRAGWTQTGRVSMTLAVDATEAPRKILHSRESLPVRPGAITLLYPKWIPGEHGPTGPVIDMVGLKILAGGRPLPWRRDLEELFAIHCTVPEGVTTLDVSFDFVLPSQTDGFSSGASSSPELAIVSWNQVVLYPSRPAPDDIEVSASLTLPAGWTYASALTTRDLANGTIRFEPVSLGMLVDSPVLAGVHFRRVDITPPSGVPHFIDMVSDSDAALAISPPQTAAYRRLVLEATALFGARHYTHYDFLYTLSDQVAHFGLEHHQSSDDRVAERTLIDDALRKRSADLLPHEFVHSWNGKYRRPAGLATGDFSTPMKDDLLWVYEGLTQYLGKVLTVRAGLWSADEYRENLALLAARLDRRPGREWRPLQDTADEASLLYYGRGDWDALRRDTDFYDEGALIWLDVDATIRQLTGGKKSIDDFCKLFYGGDNSTPSVRPYAVDDVVSGLNQVASYDWKTFFTTRLTSLDARAPLQGIERSGWKLVYGDTPTSMQAAGESTRNIVSSMYSLGVTLQQDGTLADVVPGMPGAQAGLGPGMKVIAVNGRKYSKDAIRGALSAGRTASAPLELIVANGDLYRTYTIDYHGGERYPRLERDPSKPDLLGSVIAPAAKP